MDLGELHSNSSRATKSVNGEEHSTRLSFELGDSVWIELYRSGLAPPGTGGSVASRPSRGAPVPDEPMKSFLPSSKARSRPLARRVPFFARYPSMTTTVPGNSDSFVRPRRKSAFAG